MIENVDHHVETLLLVLPDSQSVVIVMVKEVQPRKCGPVTRYQLKLQNLAPTQCCIT